MITVDYRAVTKEYLQELLYDFNISKVMNILYAHIRGFAILPFRA